MSYKNLLLIDDDEEDQELFVAAVKELSEITTCITSTDARKSLRLLKASELKPDIIFLDLNMPILNGQQFLKEIKTIDELKEIPVVVISTSSHGPTIRLTKELGAADFIVKPSSFDGLKELLTPFVA